MDESTQFGSGAAPDTARPELRGTFGMVSSTHWLASAAGMAALEKGGNAFDACVTAGFVLQVVEPHLNGPGGDMPAVLWSVDRRKVEVICGQGGAPAAATIARFRELGLDLIPGTGLLPAPIPGSFDAWMLMLRDYGTFTPAQVLEAAIGYAEGGYPMMPRILKTIATVKDHFLREWTTSSATYLPGGDLPRLDRLFRNLALARTYRRLISEGEAAGGNREAQIEAVRSAWYRGFVAEAIDQFVRKAPVVDTSGGRHYGLLTGQDMAGWQARVEPALSYEYGGLMVAKCNTWSQGLVMLQQLAMLKHLDIETLMADSAAFVHAVVECGKLAFADREAWYGDPDFVDVPVDALLSPDYAEMRAALVTQRASLDLQPGAPAGRQPRLARDLAAGPIAAAGAGEPTASRIGDLLVAADGATRGDTCHLDVVDRWGNMVAATPSGGWLQSSPLIPELGFCLGTRLQIFWLEEGLANSLAPGKRPRTTLSPGLALRDEKPYLAFGTPGGDQQDQWALAFLLRHLHGGMNLQAAIEAPAFHSEHMPSSFWPRQANPARLVLEDRFGEGVIQDLRKRGHDTECAPPLSEGWLSACARDERDGEVTLRGAANQRGMQGYAVGR